MARFRTLYLLLFGVAMVPGAIAYAADAAQERVAQRRLFIDAHAALTAKNRPVFAKLLRRLKDYPLYPYLVYDDLSTRLGSAKTKEVRDFIDANIDSPLSPRLRDQWLLLLAQQKRWSLYKDVYEPRDDDDLRCYYLRARLATEKLAAFADEVKGAWLVGHSQPAACDPVFDAWSSAGGITDELLWKRIRLAIDAGNMSLAGFLSHSLDANGKAWVDLWLRMHRSPAQVLDQADVRKDEPIARDIMIYGLIRLARLDVDAANDKWTVLKPLFKFERGAIKKIEREIALLAAQRNHPRALEWLGALDTTDEAAVQWRARAALSAGDWRALLTLVNALPSASVQDDQWLYWKGRALHELAVQSSEPAYDGVAFDTFDGLAKRRGYYGFLAADRLSRPYEFNHVSVQYSPRELAEIDNHPGVQRAYELLFMNRVSDARKEWLLATAKLNDRELQLAAVLAHQWGWHDRAIFTLAKGSDYDDLDLRFPMVYQDQVAAAAARNNLDPAWVYGIMRQESAFMTDARSSTGALGLMQLMPPTARMTAKLLKTPYRGNAELLDLDRNIELGSAYLKHLAEQYDGHQVLVTAAYNAGPNRVRTWMPDHEQSADVWVELMPFNETREYVKRVLAYTTIFEKRLGAASTRLSARMPPIKP